MAFVCCYKSVKIMKDIKLKLTVEVIRRDSDITDEDLLANVRRLVVGSGTGGGSLMIRIKDVQPMKKKRE
jgi:hypothetical protein